MMTLPPKNDPQRRFAVTARWVLVAVWVHLALSAVVVVLVMLFGFGGPSILDWIVNIALAVLMCAIFLGMPAGLFHGFIPHIGLRRLPAIVASLILASLELTSVVVVCWLALRVGDLEFAAILTPLIIFLAALLFVLALACAGGRSPQGFMPILTPMNAAVVKDDAS